jgi:predicted RNA-binding Zn-ribbon protein involved in translation (DUF1610 family)
MATPIRYWNPALQHLYDRVGGAGVNGAIHVPLPPKVLSDGRSKVVTKKQITAVRAPLRADVFAPLLTPGFASPLAPPRPAYAALPSAKRKQNAIAKCKTSLAPDEHIRALKVRLLPTPEQKELLHKMFAAARAYYNETVEILNTVSDGWDEEKYLDSLMRDEDDILGDGEQDAFYWYQFFRTEEICSAPTAASYPRFTNDATMDYGGGELQDESGLRSVVHELLRKKSPWVDEVPSKIRENAVKAAVEARDTNVAKCMAKPGAHHFRLRFRSLRNLSHTPTESIVIDPTGNGGCIRRILALDTGRRTGASSNSRADCAVHIAPTLFGANNPIRARDKRGVVDWLVSEGVIKKTAEIVWDKRINKFFLVVKRVVTRAADDRPPEQRKPLALDPGSRTFQTACDADGNWTMFAVDAKAHMKRLCARADGTQARLDALPRGGEGRWCWARRRTLRGRLRRLRRKAHNWMKHLHYEVIREMFTLGDLFLVPIFESGKMSEWAGRSYNSTVAREMYTWAHGYFRQRLWSKVQITPCKAMAFVYEPGTTRTCDACGHVMPKSASEQFACSACGHAAHRDAHGARGNLLSALGAAVGVAWDGVRR